MTIRVTFAPPTKGLGQPNSFLGHSEHRSWVTTLSRCPFSCIAGDGRATHINPKST
jgi:hypothetical protein